MWSCIHPNEPAFKGKLVDGKCLPLLEEYAQPIFIPDVDGDRGWEQLASQAYSFTSALGVWVSRECRDAGLRLACHFTYKMCNNDMQIVPPCLSLCLEMQTECAEALAESGKSVPPCVDAIFPNVSCNAGSEAKVAYSEADCPYPTVFSASPSHAQDPGGDPTSVCKLPCPSAFFSDAQWDGLFLIIYIFTPISLVLTLFYIVTSFLHPKTRRYPSNLLPILATSSLPVTIALMFGVLAGGVEKVLCSADGDYEEIGVGEAGGLACVLQGTLILYGGLSTGLWWPTLGFNLVLLVVVQVKQENLKKLQVWYHVYSWGIPVVLTIIPLAANKIRAAPTVPYCFIYDQDNDWWIYGCFYILYIITWVIGSACLVTVLISIFVRTYQFNKHGNMPLPQFIRILVVLFVYWSTSLILIVFRFYYSAVTDDIKQAAEEQVFCSAFTGTECELEDPPSYELSVLLTLALCCLGFCIFLAVGSTKRMYKYWRSLFWGVANAANNKERMQALREHIQSREWTRQRTLRRSRGMPNSRKNTTSSRDLSKPSSLSSSYEQEEAEEEHSSSSSSSSSSSREE
ncbi:hypothetical protein QOT17_018020 [Balamuthia mandrillaris]